MVWQYYLLELALLRQIMFNTTQDSNPWYSETEFASSLGYTTI